MTKETKEEPIEYEFSRNEIKVGELWLASCDLDIQTLSGLVLSLLENKNLQQYIGLIIEKKKSTGLYIG